MNPPSVICSLLCHAHVPMALRCFASLARFNREPFRLRIHDDGTLTEEDRGRLRDAVPGGVSVVSRREADEAMTARLEKYPVCLRYRQSQVMSLKLFDIALFEPGPMHYCDSDILFLRPFSGFSAPLAAARPPLVLMRDLFNTYSGGWRRLLARDRVPLADRINAGLILLDPARLDLDFVEWFMQQPVALETPHFADQTIWSALVQRDGGFVLDEERFVFAPLAGAGALPTPRRRPVAWHFVSVLRRGFDGAADAVEADGTADALPPVTLGLTRPAPLNFPRYCVSRWRKGRLARQLAREAA